MAAPSKAPLVLIVLSVNCGLAEPRLATAPSALRIGAATELGTSLGPVGAKGGVCNLLSSFVYLELYSSDHPWRSLAEGPPKWVNGNRGLEFDLRPEARFSDGRFVTAADVEASVAAYRRAPGSSTFWGGILSRVEVDAPGDHTVVFQSAVAPLDLEWLRGLEVAEGGVDDGPADGPFVRSSLTQSQLILKANPYYFGAKPGFGEVDVSVYPEEDAAWRLLVTGDLDVGFLLTAGRDALLKQDSHLTYAEETAPDPVGIIPNCSVSPFNTPEARSALDHAIDRDELVASLDGLAIAAYGATTSAPAFRYDPAAARALFGGPASSPTSIALSVGSLNLSRRIAPILERQLREVGVRLDLEAQPSLAPKDWQARLENIHSESSPLLDANVLASWKPGHDSHYADPVVDAILRQAEAPLDDATQAILSEELVAEEQRDPPFIPLVYPKSRVYYSVSLCGVRVYESTPQIDAIHPCP